MERIEKLERLISKLKNNKKINPLKIEALEWELRALKAEHQLKNCNLQNVNGSTYPKEYVVLLKPNYVAKDGSMKRAYSTFIDSHETWLAPRDDLYVR